VIVLVGDAVTLAPVVGLNPVVGNHAYVFAPLAVSGVEPDGQMFIEVGVTATAGAAFTVTVIVCVFEQLPFDPVIVYVVVTVGVAVTTLPEVALKPLDGAHE
jgi:hypothetical protein